MSLIRHEATFFRVHITPSPAFICRLLFIPRDDRVFHSRAFDVRSCRDEQDQTQFYGVKLVLMFCLAIGESSSFGCTNAS